MSQSRRTQALGSAFKVALGVAVVAMLVLLTVLMVRAEDERELLVAQGNLMIACTTPPGERVPPELDPPADDCYLRSQARTADAVARIGDLSVLAAACGAAHPADVPATRRCVEEALDGR